MIYTITFNPSLDYVLKVPELSIGKINRSENEKIYIGGKGINVSRVLNTLGMKSIPLGFIAGFTGKELKSKLIDSGIEPEFIEVREGNTRINIKIKGQMETAINANGPNINDYSIALLLKQIDDLDSNDIVVLAGYVPSTIDSSIYALICKKLYDKNIPFVVDTSGKHLIDSLKYNPFLIKPNKEELEECLGIKVLSIDDLRKGIKRLQELGALNVLVSLGEDGAMLIDDEGNEYELEVLSTLEYNGNTYLAVIPAAQSADQLELEVSVLKSTEENGEAILSVIEDEAEMEAVYDLIMDSLYEEDEEE